jgi:hypothetical protein
MDRRSNDQIRSLIAPVNVTTTARHRLSGHDLLRMLGFGLAGLAGAVIFAASYILVGPYIGLR